MRIKFKIYFKFELKIKKFPVTPAWPSAYWPCVAVAVPKPSRGIGFPELSTTAGTTKVAAFLPWLAPAPPVAAMAIA
jgi:hypothetical protein